MGYSYDFFLFKITLGCHFMCQNIYIVDMVINYENVSHLRHHGSSAKFTIITDMNVLTSIFFHHGQHVWQQESRDSVICVWDLHEGLTGGLKRSERIFVPNL